MVNKITTPPTQNEVIDKINELVDDKQDVITSSNKLSASLVSGLATVATSGSYNDLSNKPTIPTTTSSVTSGSSAALTSGGAYTNLVRRLSTSAATGSASQGVYVDANGQVQTCTAVTSTYAATGTAPVNGTAVSNAIAVKQDTLVSGTNIKTINGNSLLGSGNVSFPIVSSVSSSSTNADAVGAKLFYDTCGDIETLINAL